jgi:hypothetical protein
MASGRHLRAISMAVLLLLAPLLRAQERSLPEVARERSGKKAARVLSNEDLQTEPERNPQPPPEAASKAAQAAAADADARITVPGLLQEASLSQARAILKSLQHDEEVLLRRYAQIEEKLAGEQDEHLRRLYSDSLSRREETLARKREQIARVQKAIKAAETPPGSRHDGESVVQK